MRHHHIFESLAKPAGNISLPAFQSLRLYMHALIIGTGQKLPPSMAEFDPVVDRMLSVVNLNDGDKIFVTIDQKHVTAGQSHRRPGPHVDGNYIFDWGGGGGNGWLTGTAGRVLSPENHKLQYCNPRGGMIIASDHKACRGWIGQFTGQPNQGGDCSHLQDQLDLAQQFWMDPNKIYVGNSTFIHESVAVARDVDRTLVRITLPPTFDYIS